ncbi:MAG: hypothetical protein CFE34_02865 [Rhodobacteraceae bacterium PARR1]|nr:MAG: hypothetical protein CFE34_02865 [Rhodobacteraceae bacterium PARR1]
MPTYSMSMQSYLGSLLALNFLSTQQTLFLSFFGSTNSVSFTTPNDRFYVGEDLSIGGGTWEVVGSGWVQPGISIFGLVIPTGTRVDAILVKNTTTGALSVLYPDGVPWATGMIAMVIDIDPVGYNNTTKGPLCFLADTRLATMDGWIAAGKVAAGDRLMDRDGRAVTVLATCRAGLAMRSHPGLWAVRTETGAGLSQQHRVTLSGAAVEMFFGVAEVLAPALSLAEAGLARLEPARARDYVHVLTDRHAILLAEGLEAETLLLGPVAELALAQDGAESGIDAGDASVLADFARDFPHRSRRAALPLVTRREARVLLDQGARPVMHHLPMARVA